MSEKYTVVFEWPNNESPEISIADTWKGGRILSVCFDDALSNIETLERERDEAREREVAQRGFCEQLERQLAEARAELERVKQENKELQIRLKARRSYERALNPEPDND